MNSIPFSRIVSTGLAIFSMLFGAGNLMYPLQVGMESGVLTAYGMAGFLITAVCLPIAGLIAMLLFDGNPIEFYHRLGTVPGSLLLFLCIMVLGPVVAIPRITTLSHTMIAPFLPPFLQQISVSSSFVFACLFLGLTFLATYRESKIVDILGTVISPLLLLCLAIIIGVGYLTAESIVSTNTTPLGAFTKNLVRGYETLDLLGTIFFASIVLGILKQTVSGNCNPRRLAFIGLQSGIIGVVLLALVYIGMSVLGAYHGHGLNLVNAGELFREVSFNVLGSQGALIISTAVLMACLSTSIALSAVVAEYIQRVIARNRLSYVQALLITLLACLPLSTFGLSKILQLTAGPLLYIGYPVLITLTMCNILYKTAGFKPVKIPVLIALVIASISYYNLLPVHILAQFTTQFNQK